MKLFMLKYNTNTFLIHISENSHVKLISKNISSNTLLF